MAGGAWFPEAIEGELVVLRRHLPANLPAFRRWYSDPEVARLARYQDGPMRTDEIDRFFQVRALGPDALAMAIHARGAAVSRGVAGRLPGRGRRGPERLIGSCAFSQLDPDNGSAMYHITIGEKDAWGRGYGTEATRLMLGHAFGTLGLHRIALSVFEFNERAIRAYRRCGFQVEGRAREAIWRDGRWWDEIAMSVLASEWRGTRETGEDASGVAAPATARRPVLAGTGGRAARS